MEDHVYVATLQEILTNENPQGIDPNDPYGQADDGIDRYDGFGRDMWVESLRAVDGEHGSEIEVSYRLAVPPDPAFKDVPEQGTVRVPFDEEWRRLSGYEDPATYAPEVARRVQSAAGRLVERHRPGSDWSAARQRVRDQLPGRSQQWRMLVEELAGEGVVTETAPGRITVEVAPDRGKGGQVTVLVTPEQWEEVLVVHGGAYGYFWEWFGSRAPDEIHLVFDDGDLVLSIREELPPVRSTAHAREVAQRIVDARGKAPNARGSVRWDN